jgi:hypothetical protein
VVTCAASPGCCCCDRYIIPRPQPSVAAPAATDDDAAEGSGKSLKRATREDGTDALDERELKAPRGESGKAKRGGGQNKGRKFANLKCVERY